VRLLVGGSLLFVALAVPTALLAGSFFDPVDYPVGANPTSLAYGDLDGDGKMDLAVANHDDAGISILEMDWLNTTFEPKVDYPVGSGPTAITIADFSGDGRPDIATANDGDRSISILEANFSGGTFESKVDIPAGGRPGAIVAGKFGRPFGGGDGIPSGLAVTDIENSNVLVTLFNSRGIPAEPVGYKVGDSPSGLVTASFNGDSRPDLATANSGVGTISVLLGNEEGTFGEKLDSVVGANPLSLAPVDLNGDGKQDLVVAKEDGTVSVLRGKGTGTFKALGAAYPVGAKPVSIALGRFNNDQWLDFATANYDDGSVSVLEGEANGSFSSRRDYLVGGHPSSIVAIDGRRKGNNDIAIANATDGDVSVLVNPN
jgi:hypothetical protein